MKGREFIGLTFVIFLGILILIHNFPIGTTSDRNMTDNSPNEYKIPEANAIGIQNGNVSKTSDGNWNLTFGVFTQQRMKYMAVLAIWYDSSDNLISKSLIWNQSISDYDETYPASTVAHMNNNATPTKIEIIYDYCPLRTNNETQAVYVGYINNTKIKWNVVP